MIKRDKQGNVFIGGVEVKGELEYKMEPEGLSVFNKTTGVFEAKRLSLSKIADTDKKALKVVKKALKPSRTIWPWVIQIPVIIYVYLQTSVF